MAWRGVEIMSTNRRQRRTWTMSRAFFRYAVLAIAVTVGLALAAFAQDPHAHSEGVSDPCLGTADKADLEKVHPTKPPYSPYAGRNFPTQPLFGDTHLH